MKRRSAIFALVVSLLIPVQTLAPSHAERKNTDIKMLEKKASKIKCKSSRAAAQTPKKVEPPTALLKRGPRTFTLTTNCGDIVIQTNFKSAPVTVTVLTALMNAGYYNRTFCHRLTVEEIYILQCGDPTGTGAGDPGFRYRDENLPTATEENYPEGTVAMANGGPNTNGSQFFIAYDNTTLGPNYTIWGRVTQGLEIVKYIASGGVRGGGSDGRPVRDITIEKVTVR